MSTERQASDIVNAAIKDLKTSSVAARLAFPSNASYNKSLHTYFSQQESNITPSVIVVPQTIQDVAETVFILSKYHNSKDGQFPCFAVRGGGKAPWAGIANIQAGITIDMSSFNTIAIDPSRQHVKIGAGSKWGDVYPVLDAADLAISGGRDAAVGVGGLTLGGGMSFFGPQYGFVCDDVLDFEIVLASGQVVHASAHSHRDLWRALKGGSNNFGIVTSFTFRSFDFGNLWGGQNVYPPSTAPQHLDAIYNFTQDPKLDPQATVIQSFALYQGSVIINEGLKYTKPVDNPSVFGEFLAIQPVLQTTNRISSLTDFTIEQSGFNTQGHRQAIMSTTFVNDRGMLQYAFETWNSTLATVENIDGIQWSITFQPLPPSITHASLKSGGNVLGLEEDPALILTQLAITWNDCSDDKILVNTGLEILSDIDETAKQRALFRPFKYLDYAWSTQDVIGGYGPVNKAFLQDMSKQYDPHGLFHTGLPGGFKLFGK